LKQVGVFITVDTVSQSVCDCWLYMTAIIH